MKKNHKLFSKALFKQSIKANGIMWLIITCAVCFMLSCVMLISGTSNISSVKDGVQDTIIEELIKSEIKKSSLKMYQTSNDDMYLFDTTFVETFNKLNTKENYDELNKIKLGAQTEGQTLVKNKITEYVTADVTSYISNEIMENVASHQSDIEQEVTQKVSEDVSSTEGQAKVVEYMNKGMSQTEALNATINYYKEIETVNVTNKYVGLAQNQINTPLHQSEVSTQLLNQNLASYTQRAQDELSNELANISLTATNNTKEKFKELYVIPSYNAAINAIKNKYNNNESNINYGAIMVTINPNNLLDNKYVECNEAIPDEFIERYLDYMQIDVYSYEESNTPSTYLNEYVISDERKDYEYEREYNSLSMLIANRMTDKEYKKTILDKLSEYNVSEEKYDNMGFNYSNTKTISYESMLEFQEKINYEINRLDDSIKNDQDKLHEETKKISDAQYLAVAGSLLDKLPKNVSDGIEELGTMDLYGLIVGSIFFKMAGLLLPIIYVIMTSNNLIASQVDTGSMAYVLSTSTRREEVTFTQALYLIGSLFLMFVCTTITSCICFKIANVTTDLTYGKLVLINLGAFITLFAISGINFLTSCFFDRSKKAMALGGGISMFFLVATMLGLFGSPVIPSVVRISALNNFNYVSLITLFDVVSILNGENAYIYKFIILILIGLIGYIIGSIKFKKKDLPL